MKTGILRLVSGAAPITPPSVTKGTHPRGVFEADATFDGLRVYTVYSCGGKIIERREMAANYSEEFGVQSVSAALQYHCPADHTGPCPFDQLRLRAV